MNQHHANIQSVCDDDDVYAKSFAKGELLEKGKRQLEESVSLMLNSLNSFEATPQTVSENSRQEFAELVQMMSSQNNKMNRELPARPLESS